ncbi:histidine kinase [Nostoc linckia z18]|uniref:Histidine kinase n=2 Tax=Nostoc linckia TaxID=92942 RepID=A0A9Q6EK77_NOSLI|nr:CHASE2 domain-containing protein [Nostoc linckia]PHJ68230.1 histidine kinase [Nostoc linckia z1]PHJ73666.1 histidine kinase [Nostoc linckia z3]PHK30207.1 histidine kinase [Nostoc linckia z18]PHK35693.1 histidine kinase [Nostoc linckia z15]PHK43251.1 histidine kinase [Nostoc linckia z16]
MVWVNWRRIQNEIKILLLASLPGTTFLIVIVIARLYGFLQDFELTALDTFLRWRPGEVTDDKVVIVGINEEDIRSVGKYPIPDREIAAVIEKIQKYKPVAIGLDIFRNFPVEPGHQELIKVFQKYPNIIGIEKILPPDLISPPPQLPPKQIGFSDIIADKDNKYRRYLLWTPSPKNPQNPEEDKFSLGLQLAQAYLSHENINMQTGIVDKNTIRFKTTELPRFLSNTGGYINENDSGLKILINFRSGKKPFHILSLNDIKAENINPNLLQNKVVIIGITAISSTDFVNTSATIEQKIRGQISGVEFHAHACSQIINAVINGRPLLKVWSEEWEYIWIIACGFYPIIIFSLTQSLWKNLLAVVVVAFALFGLALVLIEYGWWIPIAPGLLTLIINGLGLSGFAFALYQHNQLFNIKMNERQHTIEHAFTVIHNGPLQTLANVLRQMQAQDWPYQELKLQLEKLNYEIREIGEYLKLEALSEEESLRLGSGLKLDLKCPIHELFYAVYTSTLERQDLEYLKNIKVKIRTFEPVDDKCLSVNIKQELCLFLEEALCNVGKHAKGVKRIEAIGKKYEDFYILKIQDNGPGLISSFENKGTKQLKNIAKNLGGDFRRESIAPKGTVCEISWRLRK